MVIQVMSQYRTVSLLYLLGHFGTLLGLSQTSFSLGNSCNFQERFDNGCFERVKDPRDQLECVVLCGWKDGCTGAQIISGSNECYHERTCTFISQCSSTDLGYRYYTKAHVPITSPFVKTTAKQTVTASNLPTITSSTMRTTEQHTSTSDLPTTTSSLAPTTDEQPTTTQFFSCLHSGVQVSSLQCDCSVTDGWVGDRCERRPFNCSELSNFGYSSRFQLILIDIYRNNSHLVNTPCNVGSVSSEIGFLKNSGQFSTYRKWSDYVNGFYHNSNNYWLGLENILAYNVQGLTKIGVQLTFSSVPLKGTISQEYNSFRLSGNSTGYSYTIGSGASSSRSVSGSGSSQGFDLGDIFNPCQNIPFSTFDNDQDMEPTKNCANLSMTAWWYKTCTPTPVVSPLGNFYSTSREGHVFLPKYNIDLQEPRNAFKNIYMYLAP